MLASTVAYKEKLFDASETVKGTVANATTTRLPLCIVTIYFLAAFDNISHTFLITVLQEHGFSELFQLRIKRMYGNAQSLLQINWYTSSHVPIHSSLRQGCPLRMALFALCRNPLLYTLGNKFSDIRIGQSCSRPKLSPMPTTSPAEFPIIHEVLKGYETASGERVNIRNSKALAIAPWDTSLQIMESRITMRQEY
jgi:hypothetical protein